MTDFPSYRFSVAPMIDWTDRHCRFFHRQFTQHALLYTEMIVADAILRGDQDHLLSFDDAEHPVALQIGGSDPMKLAAAAKIGEDYGYQEINLNVGCPSDRVQSGAFGACLMRDPPLVADCVDAMRHAVNIPVTVKCRIGVDDQEPAEILPTFIETVAATGCHHFIIHARKAWLKGLSPKENRTIPPLDYDLVHDIKRNNPNLQIVLNGGITGIDAGLPHLDALDGIMLGRASYEMPMILSHVDEKVFGVSAPYESEYEIVAKMIAYINKHIENQTPHFRPHRVTRHMLGLFHGKAGAREWRRQLTLHGPKAQDTNYILNAQRQHINT